MDTEHIAITEPVRRLEIFTGASRRRKWSHEDKARIVAEIVASGDPLAYLTDVLTKIVNGHPNSEIDRLLPWAYRRQHLKAVA